jgi:hypothetical protein
MPRNQLPDTPTRPSVVVRRNPTHPRADWDWKAELANAYYTALMRQVEHHVPALAEAFKREILRLESTKNSYSEEEYKEMLVAIRAMRILSLKSRRQAKDPYHDIDLLIAYELFYRLLKSLAGLPTNEQIKSLREKLPSLAARLGYARTLPEEEVKVILERSEGGTRRPPSESALLLLAHYTRHTTMTLSQYIKRIRRVLSELSPNWRSLLILE